MPLGSLQQGSIDIVNSTVDQLAPISNRGKELFVFRIVSPRQVTPIEIAATSHEEMIDWIQKIRETAQSANDMVSIIFMLQITNLLLKILLTIFYLFIFCPNYDNF